MKKVRIDNIYRKRKAAREAEIVRKQLIVLEKAKAEIGTILDWAINGNGFKNFEVMYYGPQTSYSSNGTIVVYDIVRKRRASVTGMVADILCVRLFTTDDDKYVRGDEVSSSFFNGFKEMYDYIIGLMDLLNNKRRKYLTAAGL